MMISLHDWAVIGAWTLIALGVDGAALALLWGIRRYTPEEHR